MTEEQFRILEPYEQSFRWAIRSNFIHMSNGEFTTIKNLYHEVFGKNMTVAQSNCNACRLKALQEMGRAYFEYKEAAEAEKNAEKKPQEEDGALKPAETPENGTEIPENPVEEAQAPEVEETPEKATEEPVEEPKTEETNKDTTAPKKKAGRPKKIDLTKE